MEDAADLRDLFEGPGRWHPLHGDSRKMYAADVTGAVRIIVRIPGPGSIAVVTVENAYH